ncbi:MAG: translation initiation factor IF-2 subunit alpha [archaeon]
MTETTERYPEVNELVVATVARVIGYGAYVRLDEYEGREGLIHISEVATTWVRNINNYLREGQKLVLRVLRVNRQRNEVDLSLRRVSGRERAETMLEWKRDKRGEGILKNTAERLAADEASVTALREKILQKYESVYDALEKSTKDGEEIFLNLDISSQWATGLTENAKSKIKIKRATMNATLQLTISKSKGIEAIKTALLNAKQIATKDSKIRIYTIGAPKYRIEVDAPDYSDAETILEEAVSEALTTLKDAGGEGQKLD